MLGGEIMEKLDRQQVMKDPIYGYIHVDLVVIKKAIDTSIFQRLRRVRQLSGVQMVFHGAEHSRFSHSLGAYEIAYRFLTIPDLKNALSEREQALFLGAALLHDLGHGAYSHAFEDIFHTNHEHIGARLILEHAELRKVLDQVDNTFAEDVSGIIRKNGKFPIIEALTSSQLDVDRLDYLERDAYFTGAAYGHIDLDRLMRVMHVKNGKIVFRQSGVHAIENYLISRYHMYWQVYYHPVSRAYEIVLEKIYLRLKDLCINDYRFEGDIEPLKAMIKNPNDLENYIKIDDFYMNGLIASFLNTDDDILRKLSDDFMNRNIWQYIDDDASTKEEIAEIKQQFSQLEQKYFTADRKIANLTYSEDDLDNQIHILLPDGTISTLQAESRIVRGLILTGIRTDQKFFYRREK